MLGKFFNKPDSENADRVPPGQHLAKGFPVLTYGETPKVNKETWQLRVWGKATEKTFKFPDFMNLPQQEFTKDFHCVTRWSKLDVKWTGLLNNRLLYKQSFNFLMVILAWRKWDELCLNFDY